MRHAPSPRWKIAAAFALGLALAVGAPAAAGSGLPTESISFNIFGGPTIRGVAVGDVNGDVWVSLHGLAPGKPHVLIGSSQPCSQSYSAADTVLSFSFGVTQTGTWFRSGASATLTGAIDDVRSFRILRSSSGGNVQRACTRSRQFELRDGTSNTLLALQDLTVSSFLKPGPHGMIVARLVDEDTVRLTVSLLNLADGVRYRVVGSTRDCARPHAARATVFGWATFPSSFQAAIVHEFRLPVVSTTRNPTSIRSLRLFQGRTQVECQGIIAILIG